jgi:hypothetical protein
VLGEYARLEGNSFRATIRSNRAMLVEPGIDNSGAAVRDFWRGRRCRRLRTTMVIEQVTKDPELKRHVVQRPRLMRLFPSWLRS